MRDKWLALLPEPFRDADAGYRYQLSILLTEFSLTQLLDTPINGRVFLNQVIRYNLNLDVGLSEPGQPDLRRQGVPRRGRNVTPGAVLHGQAFRRALARSTLRWVEGVCDTTGRPFLMGSLQLDPPVGSRSARTKREPERRR